MWKVGRISELVKGSDGNIRTVGIHLPNGKQYYRAINQLFPLEIADQVAISDKITDNDVELQIESQPQNAGRAECARFRKLPI